MSTLNTCFRAWCDWHVWLKLRRAARKSIRDDKRDHWERLATNAADAAAQGDQRKLYSMVRRLCPAPPRPFRGLRKPDGALTQGPEEELAEWDRRMQGTFGARGRADKEPSPLPRAQGALFSLGDVVSAIRKRELDKATAIGPPPVEALRLAERTVARHVLPQLNAMAQEGAVPPEWRRTEVRWIPKPGTEGHDPKDQRGFHLMRPVAASYCTALQRKLQRSWARLWTPCEHGALQGRSIRDPLIATTSMIQRSRAIKQAFVCYFWGLRKAFDLISREQALRTFQEALPEGPLQRALVDRHLVTATYLYCSGRARVQLRAPTWSSTRGLAMAHCICWRLSQILRAR